MTITVNTQTPNKVRKTYVLNSSQTNTPFVIEDRSNYLISMPVSAVASGSLVNQVHKFLPSRVASCTSGMTGDVNTIFRQEATTNLVGAGRPWTGAVIPTSRICIDLGTTIDLRAVQYVGAISSGYPNASGGAKDVVIRIGSAAMSSTYNDMANVSKSFTTQWVNGWNTTLNTQGPEGMTGEVDMFAANSNTILNARFIAFDIANSWDQYNLSVLRIRFREMAVQVDAGTTLTLDTSGPSVEQFSITDANGNFNEGSAISVVVGADTVRMSKPGRYDFIRVGSKFHVYCNGRKVGEANV